MLDPGHTVHQSQGPQPQHEQYCSQQPHDIFQNLAVEGRYLFLNGIVNQLSFSNTHYYSCCLLYLFAEANTEAIQEQFTR